MVLSDVSDSVKSIAGEKDIYTIFRKEKSRLGGPASFLEK
jgi:hypothetical protein